MQYHYKVLTLLLQIGRYAHMMAVVIALTRERIFADRMYTVVDGLESSLSPHCCKIL